jgi:hypothetical protein
LESKNKLLKYNKKDSQKENKFSKIDSIKLEKEYQKDNEGCCKIIINNKKYEINFKKMIQINLLTKKERKVSRIFEKKKNIKNDSEEEDSFDFSDEE